MQIVIDINEHLYKTIKTLGLVVEDEDAVAVSEAIRNGTPLPKGHGRLIDEQQIIDRFKPIEKFQHWYVGTDGLFNVLSDAPTIIEAESEEEE